MEQGARVRVAGPSRTALTIATGALVALTSGATAFVVLTGTGVVVGQQVELEPRPPVAAPPAQLPFVELPPGAALARPAAPRRAGGTSRDLSPASPVLPVLGSGASLRAPSALQPLRQPPAVGPVRAVGLVPVPVPVPVPGAGKQVEPALVDEPTARPPGRPAVGPPVPRRLQAVLDEASQDQVSDSLATDVLTSWSRRSPAPDRTQGPAAGSRPLPAQAASSAAHRAVPPPAATVRDASRPARAAQPSSSKPTRATGPGQSRTVGNPAKARKAGDAGRAGKGSKPAQSSRAQSSRTQHAAPGRGGPGAR